MLYVELTKYRLHYVQHGCGPPVIFLHGLSFDNRMWQPQYESFQEDFMAIGIDFRGHGFSDAPDIEYSLDTYVADVSALMNSLHLPSAILVGLSMGGAVALEFAHRYPQRVQAMVLASSAMNGHVWSTAWQETTRKVCNAQNMKTLRMNLRKYWLRDPMFAGIRRRREYGELLQSMATAFSGKPILNANQKNGRSSAIRSHLNSINCPICIINGEKDRLDFREIARQLASELHRVEWHPLDDIGHMVNLEDPEQFNQIVKNFLYRVEAGGI